MRIAFVSPGNSQHERTAVRKALERGHEVSLISNRAANPQFHVPGAQFFHYFPRTPRLRTIPIVLYLKRLLRELQPDLMLSSIPTSYGFLAALTGFHPHIAMPWGTELLHIADSSWLAREKARFTLGRADAVLCSSLGLRDKAETLGSGPASKYLFLNLCNPECQVFAPRESPVRGALGWQNKKVLIMTRNPYPIVYGVEFFIEALPLVLAEEPETRVLMVGSGSLDRELRARVGELGIEDKVHFAGWVEHSEMPHYLNAADIYVSLSLTDAGSMCLLEAMACGLPAVLSDTPDSREWVSPGKNGLLVDVGDYSRIWAAINQHLRKHPDLWNEMDASSHDSPLPVSATFSEDVAAALLALLRDPEARQEMGRRNRQIIQEQADLDLQFAEFERIAERLIAEHRSPAPVMPA